MEGSTLQQPNSNPTDFPFPLSEGEAIKFSEKSVSFSIKNDDDEIFQSKNGILVLTTQKVLWYNTTEKKGVFFLYPNAISHGYNKLSLICLINFENDEGDEAYNGVFGNPEGEGEGMNNNEEEEKEQDVILEKLKNLNVLGSPEDFVQIIGSYHVEFEFDGKGRSNVQDVFNIFSECSSMNPDKDENNNNNFMNMLGINPDDLEEEDSEEEGDGNGMEEEKEEKKNGENEKVFE